MLWLSSPMLKRSADKTAAVQQTPQQPSTSMMTNWCRDLRWSKTINQH